MSSINSNSGHYDNLNSSTVPILEGESFIGRYSSCLNFALIEISVNCDSTYDLSLVFSPDGVSDEFTQTYSNDIVSADTLFYRFEPKMRYYKVVLFNKDNINQTSLSLQCLLKSTNIYQQDSVGLVTIAGPLNQNGSVFVGGSFDISGQVVDISGQVVDISGQVVDISGQVVDISGQVVDISGQVVDISGQVVDISGQTVLVDISGQVVDISGQVVDISGQVVDISGQVVDISGQTVVVDISGQSVVVSGSVSTDVFSLLNNQRLTAHVWQGVQVAQNETSSAITPSLSSYCNTVLSCYGSSTEDAVIAVQFSNDATTFYTTQYQYTLSAGDFGFSIPFSASSIRLKLLSATTTTLIAFIDIC